MAAAISEAAVSERPLLPGVGTLSAGPADAAETLVYLHGWGGCKELWWNALADLAGEFRGIALDLPGTGGTPLPPGLATMADLARWVRETCTRLGLESVTLVGHSLGGNLAAQVALDHPALVRRLVLVDAALEPEHLPPRSRLPLSPRYGLAALRLMRLASLPLAAVGARVPHDHPGGYWRSYARRTRWYLTSNTDAALQVQLRALSENPLDAARLAALRMPLLIVHGEWDAVVPVARARALAAALPHARLALFPTAHHCPMDTDPPAFARLLRAFCGESA
ncbi:MAG: alpha/beta hydrolase [Armatimonadetes bacterium]|nr:alpha/beta hydrolase [Armatimonadota bacterium]